MSINQIIRNPGTRLVESLVWAFLILGGGRPNYSDARIRNGEGIPLEVLTPHSCRPTPPAVWSITVPSSREFVSDTRLVWVIFWGSRQDQLEVGLRG